MIIRIGDNGIRKDHLDEIPLPLRHRNRRQAPGGFVFDDGISSDRNGLVEPPAPDRDWWHGAEVTHLALGRTTFWRGNENELSGRIRVTFARLFDASGGNTVRFREGLLADSLEAWQPRPAVVNFSIGSPLPFPGFDPALRQSVTHRQVVIVAAGNEERSLSEHPSYPALYARDHPSLVVVGAHDRRGRLLGISNHGREYVHLLAPGCGLGPTTGETGMDHLTGTSFAAPIVSFTAAMLLSLTPPEERQSVQVHERLRITARRPAQEDEAAVAYGILDVLAALRLYDDVLRLNDGTLLHGEWGHAGDERDRQTVESLCRKRESDGRNWSTISLDRVARVRVHRQSERVRLRILVRERSTGRLPFWEDECEPATDGVDFTHEGGSRQVRSWRDVADLMPARDSLDRRRPVPSAGIIFGRPGAPIFAEVSRPLLLPRPNVVSGEAPTPMAAPEPLTPAPDPIRDALVRSGLAPENPTVAQQRAAIEAFQN
ncbi:MAG: S8 family serine peptidase, partial [Roseomonas sp.]|nr:S8 family serine peptidase [Roseomonas sp.]